MNRRRASIALVWTTMVLAAGGCLPARPDEPLQGAVLIVLDTVRADHLSGYGHSQPTSPNLDGLAKAGVLFERAVSCAPWTRPSVAAILTGRYPATPWGDEVVAASVVERIRGAGYATAGFTEGGFFTRKFGMDRGFETYAEERGAIVAPQPGGGIANTFRQAEAWLASHKADRFFLLIHTYEPHAPYVHRDFAEGMPMGAIGERFSIDLLDRLQSGELTLSRPEIEYVRALYEGDILNSDHFVGRFRGVLRELGLDERTLLVVTSDHGEEMADHAPANIGDHGHSLYDDLLLVPLIVYDPRAPKAGTRVRTQVRTIDVLPTITDLLGLPADPDLDGASLTPVMAGADVADRPAISGWNRKGRLRASLRDGRFKYVTVLDDPTVRRPVLVSPPDHELFDLARDPGEKTNLHAAEPERARAMHASLMEARARMRRSEAGPSPAGVDREAEERLRSLGYVQ